MNLGVGLAASRKWQNLHKKAYRMLYDCCTDWDRRILGAGTGFKLLIYIYKSGRCGEIRTPDPFLPKEVRYQAALHTDTAEI